MKGKERLYIVKHRLHVYLGLNHDTSALSKPWVHTPSPFWWAEIKTTSLFLLSIINVHNTICPVIVVEISRAAKSDNAVLLLETVDIDQPAAVEFALLPSFCPGAGVVREQVFVARLRVTNRTVNEVSQCPEKAKCLHCLSLIWTLWKCSVPISHLLAIFRHLFNIVSY